jgi:hypothetical protein
MSPLKLTTTFSGMVTVLPAIESNKLYRVCHYRDISPLRPERKSAFLPRGSLETGWSVFESRRRSKSKLLHDWRSVSQHALVSSTLVGLATRYYFLSECCCLVSVGRPLWREQGATICSVITLWFESRRTRNHTLLPHLRLLQPGWPGSRIYIPQEQGRPVIPPGTGLNPDAVIYSC